MNTNTKSIVIVEDDDLIRENYAETLSDEGYSVSSFAGRQAAYEFMIDHLPDLAILDISLGRERDGGILLCLQLRQLSTSLPIIFLTSYDSENERIEGISCEVDDYITKNTSIDYLIVRIATLFKRISSTTNNLESDRNILQHGDLKLDLKSSVAYWKEQPLQITLTQYWMLQEIALRPGETKSPSKLMSAANMVVEPNTIAANIKSIRKSFKNIDPEFDQIKAEYGAGYRWVND